VHELELREPQRAAIEDGYKLGIAREGASEPRPDRYPYRPRTDLELARMVMAPGYEPARPLGVVNTKPSPVEGSPAIVWVENQQPFVIASNAMKRVMRANAKSEIAAFVKRAARRRKAEALDTRVQFNSTDEVKHNA